MLQNANQTTTQKPSKILDNGYSKGNSTSGVKGEASTGEIEGNGRCLSLIYNTEKHIYKFHGTECTSRRQYLCEIQKRDVDNEISRIAKRLMLPDWLLLDAILWIELFICIYLFNYLIFSRLIFSK